MWEGGSATSSGVGVYAFGSSSPASLGKWSFDGSANVKVSVQPVR